MCAMCARELLDCCSTLPFDYFTRGSPPGISRQVSWLLLRVLLRWRSTSWGTFMALAVTSAVYAVCYNAIAGALGEEARE